jgi:hypothetical protein
MKSSYGSREKKKPEGVVEKAEVESPFLTKIDNIN